MNKKVIITGSTGMVGKGVLLECLKSDKINEVLVINRSLIKMNHPKLKAVLLKDFSNFESIKDYLKGYDACFHCMGISAAGMSEEKYTAITFGITKNLVDTLFSINQEMVFTYVSGQGIDSSEKSGSMWTKVKGKTENYILNKGFSNAIMFRPGGIIPEKGIRSKTALYQTIYTLTTPLHWLMKKSMHVTTTTKLGLAMIACLFNNTNLSHIENAQINDLAEQKL